MRELRVLIVFLSLTFTLSLVAEPHVSYPSDVVPGGVISLFIWDDHELGKVEAELEIEGKTVAWADGFVLADPAGAGRSIRSVLLPVASTQKTGAGRITITYDGSGRSGREERSLRVKSRDFISEEIPLNQSMSDLRKTPDPEKTRQSRELYSLLTRVNPGAVYLDQPLRVPVESLRLTSFYGDRRTYLYSDGAIARSIHTGIDYSAVPGTAVNAAGRGRVVFSGNRIISGETVVIEHLPGVYSLYFHMRDRYAREGEVVDQGTLIGTVGATGLVTGAHLHWEVRVNGVPVAPEPLMSAPLIDKESLISMIGVR